MRGGLSRRSRGRWYLVALVLGVGLAIGGMGGYVCAVLWPYGAPEVGLHPMHLEREDMLALARWQEYLSTIVVPTQRYAYDRAMSKTRCIFADIIVGTQGANAPVASPQVILALKGAVPERSEILAVTKGGGLLKTPGEFSRAVTIYGIDLDRQIKRFQSAKEVRYIQLVAAGAEEHREPAGRSSAVLTKAVVGARILPETLGEGGPVRAVATVRKGSGKVLEVHRAELLIVGVFQTGLAVDESVVFVEPAFWAESGANARSAQDCRGMAPSHKVWIRLPSQHDSDDALNALCRRIDQVVRETIAEFKPGLDYRLTAKGYFEEYEAVLQPYRARLAEAQEIERGVRKFMGERGDAPVTGGE